MNSGNSLSDFFSPKNSGYSTLDLGILFKDSALKSALSKTYFFDKDVASRTSKSSGGAIQTPLKDNDCSVVDFKVPNSIMRRASPILDTTSKKGSVQSTSETSHSATYAVSQSARRMYFPSASLFSPISSSPLSASLKKDPIFIADRLVTSSNPLGMCNKNVDISDNADKIPVPILPIIVTADAYSKENACEEDISYLPHLNSDAFLHLEVADQLSPSTPIKETDLVNSTASFDAADIEPFNPEKYAYENRTLDPKYTQAFEENLSRFTYKIETPPVVSMGGENAKLICMKKGTDSSSPKKVSFKSPKIELPQDTCNEEKSCNITEVDDSYDVVEEKRGQTEIEESALMIEEGNGEESGDDFSYTTSHDDIQLKTPAMESTKKRWFLSLFSHRSAKCIKSACVLEDLLAEEQAGLDKVYANSDQERKKPKLDGTVHQCLNSTEDSASPNTFYTAKTSPTRSMEKEKEKGKMTVSTSQWKPHEKKKLNKKTHKIKQLRDKLRAIFQGLRKGEIREKELTELRRVITNAKIKGKGDLLTVRPGGSKSVIKQQIEARVLVIENQPLMTALQGKGKVGQKVLKKQLVKCVKHGELCILEKSDGGRLVTIDISQVKGQIKY